MPWVEWKPLACPVCGADWTVPRSHLTGWGNQRFRPCRSWTCRRCDAITYIDDLPSAPRGLREFPSSSA